MSEEKTELEELQEYCDCQDESIKQLVIETEMFRIFLEEASLKHSFASFKGEYRRRLEKKAQAEANKAKMKEANDAAAAEKTEVKYNGPTERELDKQAGDELTQCNPGVQLPDESEEEAEEDNDEFTDSESTDVEVEEELPEETNEFFDGEVKGE